MVWESNEIRHGDMAIWSKESKQHNNVSIWQWERHEMRITKKKWAFSCEGFCHDRFQKHPSVLPWSKYPQGYLC
jgi:hypothetical protein